VFLLSAALLCALLCTFPAYVEETRTFGGKESLQWSEVCIALDVHRLTIHISRVNDLDPACKGPGYRTCPTLSRTKRPWRRRRRRMVGDAKVGYQGRKIQSGHVQHPASRRIRDKIDLLCARKPPLEEVFHDGSHVGEEGLETGILVEERPWPCTCSMVAVVYQPSQCRRGKEGVVPVRNHNVSSLSPTRICHAHLYGIGGSHLTTGAVMR
jgi:hypothetical protein